METENSVPRSEINININYETDAETVLDADTEYRTKKIRKLFYIYSGLASGLLGGLFSYNNNPNQDNNRIVKLLINI